MVSPILCLSNDYYGKGSVLAQRSRTVLREVTDRDFNEWAPDSVQVLLAAPGTAQRELVRLSLSKECDSVDHDCISELPRNEPQTGLQISFSKFQSSNSNSRELELTK